MIDARDYKTNEELEKAMNYERDVSELECVRKQISSLTIRLDTIIQKYSNMIAMLKQKEKRLSKSISDYQKELIDY